MYAYVGNNPVGYVDPFGLEARKDWSSNPLLRLNAIEDVISENLPTKELVQKYDPTWGDPSSIDKLYQLNAETIYGWTDIDWALTLAHASYESGMPPELLYNTGKIYWALTDEGRKYFKEHMRAYRGQPELNAIKMANALVEDEKEFAEFFPYARNRSQKLSKNCLKITPVNYLLYFKTRKAL